MSVRFKNAAGLATAVNSKIGAGRHKFGFCLRFKIHTPPDFAAGNLNQWIVSKGNMVYFRMYKATAGSATPQVYIRLGAVGGGAASSTPVVLTSTSSPSRT